MYQFANMITPEHQTNIAARLYMDMVKSGYTSVAEFHYLHNQPDGGRYDNPAEMSFAITEAASQVGIGLTHLPTLYMSSNFGDVPLKKEQSRFYNSIDSFQELLSILSKHLQNDNQSSLGIALHSLRAVSPSTIKEVLHSSELLNKSAPIHIHISEQMMEVEECIRWCGKRQ